MAQDILITPGIVEPQILFRGSGASTTAIELNVLAGYQSASGNGTALVFEGTEGQLFSITDNLSSGTIFNIGDITGLSLFSVDANGTVKVGEFGTGVIVYPGLTLEDYVPSTTTNVLYNNAGVLTWAGNLTASSFIKSGGTSSQFLKADGSVDSSTYLTGNQTITLTGDASGSGTTSIAVTVLNDSHTHDSRYYTETEIANYFSGTTAITGYNKTNWDTAYGWGNHASAGYLTGNQTITLTGDASGSGTTSISVTVANDSHTHDTRYYTETEIANFFSGSTAITGYSKSNWDTAYGWGNHASAGYLTGNQTITLSGDASGSGTTSISVVVADDSHNHIISNVDGLQAALDAKLATSLKGAANGLAELDANGTVPASQLPSYVDDVLEYAATANFPATGETGKIYVAQDTNKTYRWSGSSYVEISASLALGSTSSTAHRGDHGSTAYTHSQTTTGSVHGSSTVGGNFLRLSNPSAVTFIRVNADNTVSTLDAATFRTAIGAGTSSTTGTVTSVASGNGMNFTTITGSGTVTMGTPSSVTLSSANSASGNTHTHAFAPGGTTAQYIRGDGTLATLPTYTVNNGTLTMGVSGTGLTGSATFTANQSGNSTFTVTSNATSANTASAIVARDASGNFSASTVNTTQLNADNLRLDGNTLSSTNTNGNVIITPNGLGGIAAGTSSTVSGHHAVVGGGCANTSSCCFTTVSGGYTNTASNYGSTVSGGYFNNASGSHSFVGGGFTNTASGCYATASGGYISCATGNYSTVSGGCRNTASGNYSAILGGKSNDTNSCCNTFILGSNITASQVDTTFTQKLFVSHTTGATETLFNVEGSNGSLFSVSDSLSGSLMSVNNNAGLPIFEVFDDDSIVGGRFAQDDFVLTTGGDLGLGTASPSTKLQVVGDVTASSFIKSGGTSSQFLKADGSVDSSTYLTGNQTITLSGDASGSGTTSINVTVANDSHTHDTRYYTETEIGQFFAGTTAITGYNKSNWDTAYGWGNHASAGYLTGNQTITLSGDVSGSGTTSISVTVADDSHNHIISNVDGLQPALDAKANLSGATFTGDVYVGTGAADTQLHLRKADNNVSDHLIFYNGTTRVGEIGVHDNDWLRINQVTAKNIYTPRYIRADDGFWVDGTTKGINGAGNFVGGTIGGASDANVTNWDTAYSWGNHASAGYTTCTGTVTSVAAGNGLNFTTITGSGSVTLGTPGSTTLSSTNAVTTTSHTHAFAPGGTTAQYIRGDGTLATLPTYTVNNGTLTMAVSGTGLTGSASFTANQSGNSTFTVTSNATSSNTASAIVARDASGNFSAGAITATQVNVDNLRIDGSTLSSTNTNGAIVINPNGVGSTQADAGGNARGSYAVDFQRVRNTNAEAATGFNSSILGGRYNTASGCLSTVSGGSSNSATCSNSTVGGGCCNTASGNVYGFTTVSGGYCNTASGYYATVAGGGGSLGGNTASGNGSTISGGGGFLGGSTASGNYSVIAGGKSNCAGGNYSTVSGGTGNTVSGNYSTIVGGQSNNDCGFANTFILGSSINATQANTTYTQKLLVSETAASGDTIFNVEGSGGSLFSVVDDLSGALMSVNTVAGLPALEVNSDYSLTAGRFNQNDFEITSGGNVGIGTASPGTKLEVVGSATATSFIKSGGTSSQFLKADGSVDSTSYTTCTGTVTSVAAGNGLNFTTITGSGSVTLGTPGSTTLSSTNAVTTTSHTHAFAPGGTTAQYIRGDGTLATLPTYTVNNGTLTMAVSGTGLSGSATFTANQSGNSTFTVTSNATSANTVSTIVARDASGNFSAGTVNTTQLNADNLRLDGNTLSSTNTNGNIVITPNGTGGIAAGSSATVTGGYATVSGGRNNSASGYFSTVSGGYNNTASGNYSTIGGGLTYSTNTASGPWSTIAGGGGFFVGHTASGYASTISGGYGNTASSFYATVSGGRNNCASGLSSTVGGGISNCASGTNSSVSGGCCNITNARHSTINGGHRNIIQSPTNECCSRGVTIGGGVGHNSSGGTVCVTTGDITGTITCCNAGAFSTISGGLRNIATGGYSAVSGGCNNIASALFSTAGGGRSNCASGSVSTVGGGQSNCASASYSTVSGGLSNSASGYGSTIGGGGVVLFGSGHIASGRFSTIGGGGGLYGGTNTASAIYSTVSGGYCNCASGNYSTIGGGYKNIASGFCSTVPGGYYSKASKHGELSHAAGRFAQTGDAQHSTLVARRNTTDATANQVLFLDGSSARLTIPAETTWMFEIKLAAHNDTNNDGAWWTFRGGIKRDAANGTSIIGSVIEENAKDTNMSTASASVVADDTNEALEIRVTGVAAKNIRWVAVVDISQVSWGTP